MNIEELQNICKQLPHVTEDIKWENNLCFCICEKMFLIIGIDQVPASASFKVLEENFDILKDKDGFTPAPYLARYKWIKVDDIGRMNKEKWKEIAKEAYGIIKSKLPKSKLKSNLYPNN